MHCTYDEGLFMLALQMNASLPLVVWAPTQAIDFTTHWTSARSDSWLAYSLHLRRLTPIWSWMHPCPPMNNNIAPMPTQYPWAWVDMGMGMGMGTQCRALPHAYTVTRRMQINRQIISILSHFCNSFGNICLDLTSSFHKLQYQHYCIRIHCMNDPIAVPYQLEFWLAWLLLVQIIGWCGHMWREWVIWVTCKVNLDHFVDSLTYHTICTSWVKGPQVVVQSGPTRVEGDHKKDTYTLNSIVSHMWQPKCTWYYGVLKC
jgi:hypothetical protein